MTAKVSTKKIPLLKTDTKICLFCNGHDTALYFFNCYFEMPQTFQIVNFIWYKMPDLWIKKSYTFCTAEKIFNEGIQKCDLFSALIRTLTSPMKNFLHFFKSFTCDDFKYFNTKLLNIVMVNRNSAI